MHKKDKENRKKSVVRKEQAVVLRKEKKLEKAAGRNEAFRLGERLEEKIPEKVRFAFEKAFCSAFTIIFEKGTEIIEKSYDKESLGEDYKIQNYAVQIKGTRRELRRMNKQVQLAGMGNMAIAAAEGIVLGAFGIGLPDIVVFTGVLLKGVYETSLRYGIDYHTAAEKMFILKMMETAVSKGDEWTSLNAMVDEYMENGFNTEWSDAELKTQIERTSRAFAVDMLLLKFIQGIPVVGILGGMGNPVYCRKIQQYVGVKYQKRYLWALEAEMACRSKST